MSLKKGYTTYMDLNQQMKHALVTTVKGEIHYKRCEKGYSDNKATENDWEPISTRFSKFITITY